MYVHTDISLNINLRRTGGSLSSPAGTLTPVGESLAGSSFCGSEVQNPKDFREIITSKEKGPGQYLSITSKWGFAFSLQFHILLLSFFPATNLAKTFHRVQRWAAWLRSQVLPPAMAASFPLTEDFLVPGPRLFTITSGVISSDLSIDQKRF